MNREQRRGLARLMLRWPNRRDQLREKCALDPHFLDLLEAYDAACGAADHWARAGSQEGQARVNEYRALVFEIEREIDGWF